MKKHIYSSTPIWRQSANPIYQRGHYDNQYGSERFNNNAQSSKSLSLNSFLGCLLKFGTFFLLAHYFISGIYLRNISVELGLVEENIYTFEDLLTTYIVPNYQLVNMFSAIVVMSLGSYLQLYLMYKGGLDIDLAALYKKLSKAIYKKLKRQLLSNIISGFILFLLFSTTLGITYYFSDSWTAIILIIIFLVFGSLGVWKKSLKYVVIGIVISIIVFMYSLAIASKDFFRIEYCTNYVELEFNDNTIVTTNDTLRMAYHGSKYVIFRNITDSTNTLYSTSGIKRITEKSNYYKTDKN